MNKKGIVKIIEASVAILIVSSVLFINYNKGISPENPDYSENARDILEELANNGSMRTTVVNMLIGVEPVNASSEILDFIDLRIPSHLNREAKVCKTNLACGQSSYVGNVFSAERIISSNLDNYNPRKIRLFLWVK